MHHPLPSLEAWRGDFPDLLQLLDEQQQEAALRRSRLSLASTPLSIGIMGQVKAGKSSLLNSLLFGGLSLLPEAATPKTANLTRIRYAAQPSFTAHFYRPDEWAQIEHLATLAGDAPNLQAARELVAAVRSAGLDVAPLLAQGHISLSAPDLKGLLGQLNDYVGTDGRLSALVSHTELALAHEQLQGIEIVDTPGMNDPVHSRTDKTRQYMAQCDVVFFLSRASQFFDASDQALMALQLPQKGIKRLLLVASQSDLFLSEDQSPSPNLRASRQHLIAQISRRIKTLVHNLAEQRRRCGLEHTADLLQQMGAPVFISAHAWVIAHLPPTAWSPNVRHIEHELRELALERWQTPLQASDWLHIANLEPLAAALAQARHDKESLLAQQRATLETELARNQAELLAQLRAAAIQRIYEIEHHNLASLERHERAQRAQMEHISTALSAHLHLVSRQSQEQCRQLCLEISSQAQRSSQLQERTGSTRTSHSVTVSDSVWYKPWTWFSSHQEHYSTSSSYRYLASADAVENLRYYAQSARSQMLAAFDDLLTPSRLAAALRRELLRAIGPAQTDFDPQSLRTLVETSLSTLKLPQLDFELPDLDRIFAGFSGEVKNEHDMQRLRQLLHHEVHSLNTSLIQRLETSIEHNRLELERIGAQLEQLLTARLAAELAQVRAALADKAQHLAHLQALVSTLEPSATPPTP